MSTAYRSRQSYIVTRLKRVGLSEALAIQTAPLVAVQSFEAGTKLWTKGSEVHQWRLIMDGLVSASIATSSNASTPIAIYGKGAWFGEQSIINRKPSYSDYVCLTPTELLSIGANTFDTLFVQQPDFARFVAKLMAWRVQKTSETLTLMKLGNPCLRVVMGLAQFAEALSYRAERPPTIGFGEGLQLPVPQNTLASLCGVSRTLFSEYVQQLVLHGWLSVAYAKLEINHVWTWLIFARRQRENTFHDLSPSITQLLEELRSIAQLENAVNLDRPVPTGHADLDW